METRQHGEEEATMCHLAKRLLNTLVIHAGVLNTGRPRLGAWQKAAVSRTGLPSRGIRPLSKKPEKKSANN